MSLSAPQVASGKHRLEKQAVSLKFPSGAEADFVLVFIGYYVHRVFTHLIKCSFRPIFYRGMAASAFSPLRSVSVRTAILIEKTQHFENTFFFFSSSSYMRCYISPIICKGSVASFFLRLFTKIVAFHFDLQKPGQNECFFWSLLRRSNEKHKNGHLVR